MEIRDNGTWFEIRSRGHALLRHSRSHPCLAFGSGTARHEMYHGNFKIRERVGWQKHATSYTLDVPETGDSLTASEAEVAFSEGVTLHISESEGRLELTFPTVPAEVNRFWLMLPGDADEHIYGCGEQYSRLDLKGSKVPLWVSEQGVGRSHDPITLFANLHSKAGGHWYSTYFPLPAFVSSANWYCVCDASAYAEFDFRAAHRTELYFHQIPERVILGREESAVETVSAITSITGTQPALPEWVTGGMLLGVQGGTQTVRNKLEDATASGVKVSALWVQDWEGKRETAFGRQLMWNWVYDPQMYPQLPDVIAELQAAGVRLLGYINTFLAVEGSLYQEAREKGYCVKNRMGEDYLVTVTTFPAAMVDLTNPAAFRWIKDVIKKNMIGIGLAGWMADFGEYLPEDAVLHSGEPAALVHNRVPSLWARANREAVEEAGKLGEVLFFMRAGSGGSSRYATAFWAGDQLVSWSRHDGLASVIPAGISLGFTGVGAWHSDLGGYTTLAWVKRSKELFMRWAEHAAFTPLMRTHEGNRPDDNWQFNSDDQTLSHLARMTRIYAGLAPYHRAVFSEYTASGLAPIRHPYIHYENDTALHRYQYQYLYGRDLLVAPVYRKGRRQRSLFLPEDDWVHLWSGEHYGGGKCRVSAPVGQPPVFFRSTSSFAELFRRAATLESV